MDVEEAIALYNELCPSFPKAIGPTPQRKEMCLALSADGIGLPQIREAFCRAERSDFLTGRAAGADWNRFDFDWFLRPSSIVSLLEGKYDNVSVQMQKRLDKNQALHEKALQAQPPAEPLTEEKVAEFPSYLRDALKRHCCLPDNIPQEVQP